MLISDWSSDVCSSDLLDNEAPRSLAGSELAVWIYRANIALIQKADLVAANMNAFRGAEPDSGTAFEVGYAVALGKPVWAYTADSRPPVQQIPAIRQPGGSCHTDPQAYNIADLSLNLTLDKALSFPLVRGQGAKC